jgi:hypothetical protein
MIDCRLPSPVERKVCTRRWPEIQNRTSRADVGLNSGALARRIVNKLKSTESFAKQLLCIVIKLTAMPNQWFAEHVNTREMVE